MKGYADGGWDTRGVTGVSIGSVVTGACVPAAGAMLVTVAPLVEVPAAGATFVSA